MAERRRSSEMKFDGRLIRVRVDEVELPSGRRTWREVVEHPGAVAVLPVTDEGKFVLVQQYRYAVGRELLEVPAGTREPGESAANCALRELREEVGFQADTLKRLTRFFVSPGWCNEELIVYRATGLTHVGADPDADEVLKTVAVVPDEIPVLMRDGRLTDAKSIIAILLHTLESRTS